jgi:hypothetical protein
MLVTEELSTAGEDLLMQLSGCVGFTQLAQVAAEVMGRTLDVEVVITEHSSPADKGIRVKLVGVLERAQMVQTACQEMRRAQRVEMVVTEHSATPSKGVLAELAGLAIGAEVEEGTGNPATHQVADERDESAARPLRR